MGVHIAMKCKYAVITVWINDDVCSESKNCPNVNCPWRRIKGMITTKVKIKSDDKHIIELNVGEPFNSNFFGFTEYQGPEKWKKTKEEGQVGRPYNLFICNRCQEFMFWSRVYGEFPPLDPYTGIDPYMEARMIAELHQKFCYVDGELSKS